MTAGARAHVLTWTFQEPAPIPSPITFVGVGADTIQNGGSTLPFDLTEPAGCASNDVLFAVIAARMGATTTPWTMPSGWVRLSAALNPSVGSNPSVMMFAYRRGASAAPLSFSYPSVPLASIGFVLAYRGIYLTNVPKVGAAVTASGSSTSVTFPINPATGTFSGHILVAATAANVVATYTNFVCADPSLNKSSGTTVNETRPVAFNQWTERRDASPSSNLSVAVFDAARQTVGTTGTPSVTASTSANQALTMNWCDYVVAPP